jgi:hypothetical protein
MQDDERIIEIADTIIERFFAKVKKGAGDECWLWTASLDGKGYGQFWTGLFGSCSRAHRVSYVFARGPIPEGMSLHHLCEVKHCVNPDHLQVCTHQENMTTGKWGVKQLPRCAAWQLAKTHCPQGHPLSGENALKLTGNRKQCKICLRAAQKEHMRRKRAEDPEGMRRKAAEYYQANKERIDERRRNWAAKRKLGRPQQ